jgi:polyhydroxybutyrate depolymerase
MHHRARLAQLTSIGPCALLALLASGACGGGDRERGQAGLGENLPDASGGGDAASLPADTLADDGLNSSGPSAGCGLASPMSGELTLDIDGRAGEYAVVLPAEYDPTRAYPLAFAFHGANRTHIDCWRRDCLGFAQSFASDAIVVFMRSFAAGWNDEALEPNVTFFGRLLAKMKAEYCVDQGRVEVAGTSSGAHFSNILACRLGDQLQSTAPVAGTLIERDDCVGRVAALVVHGIDDTQVPFANGEVARDFYAARNGCSNITVPPIADIHAQIRAARDQMLGMSACVDYQDCDPGYPVRWCEHSEGGYDNSTHGWPAVGGQLVYDFTRAL